MKIKITDASKLLTATQIATGVSTVNAQLAQWKVPWFGPDHTCYAAPTSWDWEVLVADDADQADALGYHDVSPTGKPYGKVFVKVCQQYNVPWISVLSHEVLELCGDPGANMWAHDATGKLWAFEMCDAVQDWLYTLNGQQVSNFVLPNFFIAGSPKPYDYMGKLTKPFSVNKGYSVVGEFKSVTQVFGFLKRTTKTTDTVADERGAQLLDRPDKLFAASRTQRRLHAFD